MASGGLSASRTSSAVAQRREEAERACATAVQRLRAAAAAVLGVVDHAGSSDDFQHGWTQGRRELQAMIGAIAV